MFAHLLSTLLLAGATALVIYIWRKSMPG